MNTSQKKCIKIGCKIKTFKFWKLALLVKFIWETIEERGNPPTYILIQNLVL
jgi:hypothetical protein